MLISVCKSNRAAFQNKTHPCVQMELVFVGHRAFLGTIATLLPEAVISSEPVESVERNDTAFVCPTDSEGMHVESVYDSNAMFRGSQVNMHKTVQKFGLSEQASLPMGSAVGIAVWGSAWLIGSVGGHFSSRDRGFVAYDAFYAAYIVARTLGVKRLVCPPLCVALGRVGFQSSAAQIVKAYKDALNTSEQKALATADSRGVDCYVVIFKES